MLTQKMSDILNKQVNAEAYSAYMYFSMALYFESINMSGMANWMKKQAAEENEHSEKFIDYVFERNGRVILEAIDKPKSDWSSPLEVFEEAYAHEQKVTKMIHDIYAVAVEEKDYATQSFLRWFIDEQVEEEASASKIVETLKMIGDSKQGLYMFDKELGQRQ